jgi:uncharacterized glyoxalase superfamily protein PhnB
MRPTPAGWPRISAAIFYRDPARAIDWLCQAFGFEIRLKVVGDGGRIEHSELVFGGGVIMVAGDAEAASHKGRTYPHSPRSLKGANTQSLMVYVDDVDAHCARARAAGANISSEPKNTDYGEDYWEDRAYGAEDPEGHHWWFAERVRGPRK